VTLKAIVFDFDLTLVDSMDGFFDCHSYAAAALGLPQPARDAVARLIGTPLPVAFVALYGEAQKSLADQYLRLYQRRADEVMVDSTHLLDGAGATVHLLAGAGLRLAIVSQKRRYRIEPVLEREGLRDAFDVVLGDEDLPALKPDPRGLLLATGRLAVEPSDAVYVGDTVIDAEAARRAGVPFVAVLSGPTGRREFDGYEPLTVLEGVSELPAFLGIRSTV
jgi:phosphoglycolate phosphatase